MHRGMQKKKGRPTWRERQNSNNRNKFEHFKKEIFARYNKDYQKEAKRENGIKRKEMNAAKGNNKKNDKKEKVKIKRSPV